MCCRSLGVDEWNMVTIALCRVTAADEDCADLEKRIGSWMHPGYVGPHSANYILQDKLERASNVRATCACTLEVDAAKSLAEN